MRSVIKYLLPFFALGSLMMGCSDDDPITNPNGGGDTGTDTDTEDPNRPYRDYEGYMFVLDQSQIPSNSGYESERDVPQAKLAAIDPETNVTIDILSGASRQTLDTDLHPQITLGFDCRLLSTGDAFVIVAKREWLLDDTNLKAKATVFDAKTLKLLSQVSYELPEGPDYDFLEAVNSENAFIGYHGKNIFHLNLKDGTVKKIADTDYNNNIGAFGYKNNLITINGASLRVLSGENAQVIEEVALPKNVRRAYLCTNDLLVLQYSDYNCGLLTMHDKKIIHEFKDPKPELALNSMEYDAAKQMLYAPGKDRNKDKIYTIDFSQEGSKPVHFYTIPKEDIEKSKAVTGAMKLGIQPDKRILYIAHVNDLIIAGAPGNKRGSRSGYISHISLDGKEGVELPITAPENKTPFEYMFTFSRFFFVSK